MWRARIIRSHRPDSWTRAFIGQIVFVRQLKPISAFAGTIADPYGAQLVEGHDVAVELLTPPQRAKLLALAHGFLLGELFVPAECVEVLEEV